MSHVSSRPSTRTAGRRFGRRTRWASLLAALIVTGALVAATVAAPTGAPVRAHDHRSAPAPPPVVTIRVGQRTLATRRVERLGDRRAIARWVATLPATRTTRSGRAQITLRTDTAALLRRVRAATAAGGRTIALPEHATAATIRLPVVGQSLRNDCEATALSMLLRDRGVRADQLSLQHDLPQSPPLDPAPPPRGTGPQVWGDPDLGFVGRADGSGPAGGYGVYQRPVAALARRHGVRLTDLTGQPAASVYRALLSGHAVMVWVALSAGPYETWQTPAGRLVHANFGEHSVVLTAIDANTVRANDPLSGQQLTWTRAQFERMWTALGRRALAA